MAWADRAGGRRPARDRLGGWPEIYRGLHPPLADRCCTIAAMVASMGLLGIAVSSLPVGTAYAVWTGIGTIGTALLGVVLFDEPATPARLACIAMVAAGIVGLKLVTPA